jgi:hypothetical protein
MAVRVECYAGLDHDDSRPERLLGYVSASDTDEQLLFDLLGLLAERTRSFDAREQGAGLLTAEDVASVGTILEAVSDADLDRLGRNHAVPARIWLETLISALALASELGLGLVWRTRYDRGGSVDDGPDEFPTAWAGSS